MHLSHLALAAALVALTAAQNPSSIPALVASIPSCATGPLAKAIAASGCGVTDYVCQCTTGKNAIMASASGPILAACSTSDALNVQSITNNICAAAGTVEPSVASSTSASSASSASSMSVSSAASSVASSVASSGSSVASSVSSLASSVASSASSRASSVAASTTSSTSATVSGNVAARMQAGGAVLGAAVLVAMAL